MQHQLERVCDFVHDVTRSGIRCPARRSFFTACTTSKVIQKNKNVCRSNMSNHEAAFAGIPKSGIAALVSCDIYKPLQVPQPTANNIASVACPVIYHTSVTYKTKKSQELHIGRHSSVYHKTSTIILIPAVDPRNSIYFRSFHHVFESTRTGPTRRGQPQVRP